MAKLMTGLQRWSRALVRHLPEKPYPSDHPWRDHHDPARPRGVPEPLLPRLERPVRLDGAHLGDHGNLDRLPGALRGARGRVREALR